MASLVMYCRILFFFGHLLPEYLLQLSNTRPESGDMPNNDLITGAEGGGGGGWNDVIYEQHISYWL